MKKVVESRKTLKHYELLSSNALTKNKKSGELVKAVIMRDYKILNSNTGEYTEMPEDKKEIYVKEFVDFSNNYSLVLDL